MQHVSESQWSSMLYLFFFLFIFPLHGLALNSTLKLGFEFRRTQTPDPSSKNVASRNFRLLPLLRLPYATYRASSYDPIDDIYTFTNIRFASPPTSTNRFLGPKRPKKHFGIQDGSTGHSCYQSTPTQFLVARPAIEGIVQSEDCLFLDLYVPGRVVRSKSVGSENLAILHYLYGGGFGLSPLRSVDV